MVTVVSLLGGLLGPAQLVPEGSRSVVFQRIYEVFLVLGTLVGVVVITYMLVKAYRYRESASKGPDTDRPELGELPSGGGGGRKLFLSFSLSAIIVVSLITWTYFTLLYVENPAPIQDEEPMEIEVTGHQFFWTFEYPNGHTTQGELVVPEDRQIRLVVTASDVFHNFGIPELRAKADAIPGQTTDTWFLAEETGTYQANCYELCGQGHSHMTATVQVVSQSEFDEWYENTETDGSTGSVEQVSDDTTNESTNESTNETANETASDGDQASITMPMDATAETIHSANAVAVDRIAIDASPAVVPVAETASADVATTGLLGGERG